MGGVYWLMVHFEGAASWAVSSLVVAIGWKSSSLFETQWACRSIGLCF